MKRSLTAVAVLAVGLLFGGLLSGDDKKPSRTKGTLPAGWKQLNLTAAQRDKIYSIQADYKKQIAALTKQLEDIKKKRLREMRIRGSRRSSARRPHR